jgi:acylphosphatase
MKEIIKKHVRIRVWGSVQKVFFRNAVTDAAQQFQIQGWVKNNPNETVEIEAEGEPSNVDKFVRKVHQGSDMSVVKRMRVVEGDVKDYNDFRQK